MSTKKLTLIQKLAKISEEIGPLGKDGENTFHKYKYLSIDAVYSAVAPLLSKHEVFVTSRVIESQTDHIPKGDKIQFYVTVTVEYTFHSGEESISTQNHASAMDSSDKASTQAMRAAQKYAYMQAFNIVSGESDPDEKSPQAEQKPKQQAKPKKYPTIPQKSFSFEALEKAGWDEELKDGFIKLKDNKGKDVWYQLSKEQIEATKNHLDKKHLEELDKNELKESPLSDLK